MPTPDDNKEEFQSSLLRWFGEHRRDFPWRHVSDPFHLLIAEKLLQQTAARAHVVEIYEELLRRYPSSKDLAAANLDDLIELIRPLGLTYRARELLRMAQDIEEKHSGQIPHNLKELLKLFGVGDYAARAVLSFAFGEDVPVVDINVIRFLYRLYGLPGKIPFNPSRKKNITALAAALVPPGNSRDWNLAVLDECALVCKAAKPLCPQCPVQNFCFYGAGRNEPPPGDFPVVEAIS